MTADPRLPLILARSIPFATRPGDRDVARAADASAARSASKSRVHAVHATSNATRGVRRGLA
jgi:hypothetical protein